MIVEFDKSFEKSLEKLKDLSLLSKVERIILSLESTDSLRQLKNITKLTGYKVYYRIKINEYRLGFEMIKEDRIRLIIIAHRKDIYKRFP
ncbi:MAG: type II toxin-antitoxin system RelE/ParE family toxin [Saprospiraceae bacterium]